jgi:hypothetical protein
MPWHSCCNISLLFIALYKDCQLCDFRRDRGDRESKTSLPWGVKKTAEKETSPRFWRHSRYMPTAKFHAKAGSWRVLNQGEHSPG